MKPTLTNRQKLRLVKFLDEEMQGAYHFGMLFDDGKIHDRPQQPCPGGELRPYHKTHPKEVKDDVKRPADLTMPFPDGHPMGLAYHLHSPDYNKLFINYCLSAESPWREVTRWIDNYPGKGFILRNTKVNADILANLCIVLAHSSRYNYARSFGNLVKAGFEPFQALITVMSFYYDGNSVRIPQWTGGGSGVRCVHAPVSIKRLATGTPDVPENFNWYDRSPYRRPVIERIWIGQDKPHEQLPGIAAYTGKAIPLGYLKETLPNYTAERTK